MRYFPAFIDVKGKNVLIVGGGNIGLKKAETLLLCGAKVRIVTLSAAEEVKKLAETGAVELFVRGFEDSDIDPAFMVVAATDDAQINKRIYRLCDEKGKLINSVDQKENSNFIYGATLTRGELTVAVSTGGASPGLAARIRDKIGSSIGGEIEEIVELYREYREKAFKEIEDNEMRSAFLKRSIHLLENNEFNELEEMRARLAALMEEFIN